LVHTPLWAFYLVSLPCTLCNKLTDTYTSIFCCCAYERRGHAFQKSLWMLGVWALFAFHLILSIKLDLKPEGLKFWHAFIGIWIWELTDFPMVLGLYAHEFKLWMRQFPLPNFPLSSSEKGDLEYYCALEGVNHFVVNRQIIGVEALEQLKKHMEVELMK